jgi:hypothetical protein
MRLQGGWQQQLTAVSIPKGKAFVRLLTLDVLLLPDLEIQQLLLRAVKRWQE